jgi:hypothetical protein
MKECCRCGKKKTIHQFNKNRRRKDGLQSFCRDCERKRLRGYYKENKDKLRDYSRERKKKLREWLSELKAVLACPCGESHPACLDFHHRDPKEKEVGIAKLIRAGGREAIERELKKCEVLCANCHRKAHWKEPS